MTGDINVQEVLDTFDESAKEVLREGIHRMTPIRESDAYQSLTPVQQNVFDYIVGQAGKKEQ